MDEVVRKKIKDFFVIGKVQQYKKGDVIIRAEDQPLGVMYLSIGMVKVYSISLKGDEVVVNIFKPGSFFPMSWALSNATNNFFYEALSEVTLSRCSREDVLVFLNKNPDVLLDLLKKVYSGLEGVMERLSHVMGEDAYDRLISELTICTRRFGEKLSDERFLLPLSERDLAAQTGLTRETISREMKKLKAKEYIIINKDQTITVNLKGLQSEH